MPSPVPSTRTIATSTPSALVPLMAPAIRRVFSDMPDTLSEPRAPPRAVQLARLRTNADRSDGEQMRRGRDFHRQAIMGRRAVTIAVVLLVGAVCFCAAPRGGVL